MIAYLLTNTSNNQTPGQPDQVMLIADSAGAAVQRVASIYGKGYEVTASVPCTPNAFDIV